MQPKSYDLFTWLTGEEQCVPGTTIYFRKIYAAVRDPQLTAFWDNTIEEQYRPTRDDLVAQLHSRYSHTMVKTILRSLVLLGVQDADSCNLMQEIYDGTNGFNSIHANWLQCRMTPTLDEMVWLISKSHIEDAVLPVIHPQFLEQYGYSQEDYVRDLSTYWEDIEPVYFQAWDTTHIGVDTVDTSAIRQIGQQAIEEMTQLNTFMQNLLSQQANTW